MARDSGNLIWIDLEMTGLDPDHCRIIEIATLITDSALNVVGTGPVIAIHQPDSVLAAMDEWNSEQHAASGLLERVRESGYSAADAESLTLEFVRHYVEPAKSPMCGNSICLDRRFLYRYMPELERYFHYRNLDVSSIKELCQRWAPEVAKALSKRNTHRALEDIQDSIDELRLYRDRLFKLK